MRRWAATCTPTWDGTSSPTTSQAEGLGEGDLMLIMGWNSPQMPKRYGKSAATDRAHAAARRNC
jgi:hypothetical protein